MKKRFFSIVLVTVFLGACGEIDGPPIASKGQAVTKEATINGKKVVIKKNVDCSKGRAFCGHIIWWEDVEDCDAGKARTACANAGVCTPTNCNYFYPGCHISNLVAYYCISSDLAECICECSDPT